MEYYIFWTIVIIVILDFLFSNLVSWLDQRQWKDYVPGKLKDFYNESEYLKARAYNNAHFTNAVIAGITGFIALMIMLFAEGFGWLDGWLRNYLNDPVWLALAYFGILYIASDILNLPFSLYSTFSVEERFGFNKLDIKTFFIDKLKGYMLTIIIGGSLAGILLWLIIAIGPLFWLYGLIVFTCFSVFMNYFYTSLIVPLFNKLTPLEDGELREAIEDFSKKAGFPVSNIYVIDGSRRSSKANAFFSGFGKNKKIVLYDTLIENHSKDELVAILAHEIGHYKKRHITLNLLLSTVQTAILLFLLSLFIYSESLSLAFGAETLSLHVNLIAFSILYGPVSIVLGLLFNTLSRKHEYEADAFAAETTGKPEALMEALKKLSVKHLSNLHPHPLNVFFNYSHPPVTERLEALKKKQQDYVSTT